VFYDDNPEVGKVEKPTALLSFSNINKGKNNTNKCIDLKNKLHFTVCTAITEL
jgi:hypothetical protein